MPDYFKKHGETLVELGYQIVPIPPGSKAPNRKGWPKFDLDSSTVRKWASNGSSKDGIGILAATTPAIDVDVLDEEIANLMAGEIDRIFKGAELLTRTGKAPKFLIPFRSDQHFRKLSSNVYTDGVNDHKVEILGSGQQWVAYHTHPETEMPYVWFDGVSEEGICRVEHSSLTLLTLADAKKVIDVFENIARELVESGRWSVKSILRAIYAEPTQDPFSAFAPPVSDLTDSQIEKLLRQLPLDDRDGWLRAGRILHHQYEGSDEGYDFWLKVSQDSEKFNADDQARVWASFGRNTSSETLRSLIRDYGQPSLKLDHDLNFRFYPGDDYSKDFIGGPELVEDVLPERGIAMVYGPSGKGKTFWTLDMAFRVHNGIKWRDKDVKKGNVMYIAAEAGRGIKKRIQAIKALNPDWESPFIADVAPNLSNIESIKAVSIAVQQVSESPALIIVDTMSASFEGDDSSQRDVAQMIRNLKVMADELRCLILFVHHTTKDGGSFRGSGVLYNDVDAVLELESTGEGADRMQWVTQRKHREGEDGKAYPFSLKISEPLGRKGNGKPITSCTVEQENYQPEPKKEGRKPRSGDFETSKNYEKARHFLSIIQGVCGSEIGTEISEDEVVEAIQKDKTVNPMEEPDYPTKKNIVPTLRTLAVLGKITKEGRIIRLVGPY